MADLTYNQGIHGAQDTANAMVRAGRPFTSSPRTGAATRFRDDVGRWARAAAAVTRWRSLKVGVFGYAMNGMGDIRVDVHALMRGARPAGRRARPGRPACAPPRPCADDDVRALIADEDARFEIDPRLSDARSATTTRACSSGIEQILRERGYGAYSTHFDAIAEDGRFARLPLAAASSLMAKGYGYGAEGDALTAALMSAAARRCSATTQFTEMYAMDFPTDSILMSHMGEGNWALARPDRPVRLIKRPLGIGGLDDPPTFLFQYAHRPGDARDARLAGGERFRLRGRRGGDPRHRGAARARDAVRALPAGLRGCGDCMDAWLRLGRAAPPGAQPWAPGAAPGGCSASSRDSSSPRLTIGPSTTGGVMYKVRIRRRRQGWRWLVLVAALILAPSASPSQRKHHGGESRKAGFEHHEASRSARSTATPSTATRCATAAA